jgi:DNA-binding PadR family transcriptional regulator
MTIDHAILGILSYRPMTGYDLKKVFQESTFMHWSGNNNQIYKALVELLEDGLVTSETRLSENSPSKKIYTVTKEGLEELKNYTAEKPEPLEFKKSFLINLAWADLLSGEELSSVLSEYENEISLQLLMNREKMRRGSIFVPRTEREAFLWEMINENILSSYQNELEWVRKVRSRLAETGD